LGAFGCGVFKALLNNKIKIDIVAGTSIGGINAAIIAGSKDEKHPEVALEQFWLELSQGFEDLQPFSYCYNLPTDLSEQKNNSSSAMNTSEQATKIKQLRSFYSSAIFGNDNSKPDHTCMIFHP
jgi:NTE family protein